MEKILSLPTVSLSSSLSPRTLNYRNARKGAISLLLSYFFLALLTMIALTCFHHVSVPGLLSVYSSSLISQPSLHQHHGKNGVTVPFWIITGAMAQSTVAQSTTATVSPLPPAVVFDFLMYPRATEPIPDFIDTLITGVMQFVIERSNVSDFQKYDIKVINFGERRFSAEFFEYNFTFYYVYEGENTTKVSRHVIEQATVDDAYAVYPPPFNVTEVWADKTLLPRPAPPLWRTKFVPKDLTVSRYDGYFMIQPPSKDLKKIYFSSGSDKRYGKNDSGNDNLDVNGLNTPRNGRKDTEGGYYGKNREKENEGVVDGSYNNIINNNIIINEDEEVGAGWGTICAEGTSMTALKLLCSITGLSDVRPRMYTDPTFDIQSRNLSPIYWSNLNCDQSGGDFRYCTHADVRNGSSFVPPINQKKGSVLPRRGGNEWEMRKGSPLSQRVKGETKVRREREGSCTHLNDLFIDCYYMPPTPPPLLVKWSATLDPTVYGDDLTRSQVIFTERIALFMQTEVHNVLVTPSPSLFTVNSSQRKPRGDNGAKWTNINTDVSSGDSDLGKNRKGRVGGEGTGLRFDFIFVKGDSVRSIENLNVQFGLWAAASVGGEGRGSTNEYVVKYLGLLKLTNNLSSLYVTDTTYSGIPINTMPAGGYTLRLRSGFIGLILLSNASVTERYGTVGGEGETDKTTGYVICSKLYPYSSNFGVIKYIDGGDGPVYYQNFSCSSSHDSFDTCNKREGGPEIPHSKDLGVICSSQYPPISSVASSRSGFLRNNWSAIFSLTVTEGFTFDQFRTDVGRFYLINTSRLFPITAEGDRDKTEKGEDRRRIIGGGKKKRTNQKTVIQFIVLDSEIEDNPRADIEYFLMNTRPSSTFTNVRGMTYAFGVPPIFAPSNTSGWAWRLAQLESTVPKGLLQVNPRGASVFGNVCGGKGFGPDAVVAACVTLFGHVRSKAYAYYVEDNVNREPIYTGNFNCPEYGKDLASCQLEYHPDGEYPCDHLTDVYLDCTNSLENYTGLVNFTTVMKKADSGKLAANLGVLTGTTEYARRFSVQPVTEYAGYEFLSFSVNLMKSVKPYWAINEAILSLSPFDMFITGSMYELRNSMEKPDGPINPSSQGRFAFKPVHFQGFDAKKGAIGYLQYFKGGNCARGTMCDEDLSSGKSVLNTSSIKGAFSGVAASICRDLKLSNALSIESGDKGRFVRNFLPGKGPIYLSSIRPISESPWVDGSLSTLFQKKNDCTHMDDVGIICGTNLRPPSLTGPVAFRATIDVNEAQLSVKKGKEKEVGARGFSPSVEVDLTDTTTFVNCLADKILNVDPSVINVTKKKRIKGTGKGNGSRNGQNSHRLRTLANSVVESTNLGDSLSGTEREENSVDKVTYDFTFIDDDVAVIMTVINGYKLSRLCQISDFLITKPYGPGPEPTTYPIPTTTTVTVGPTDSPSSSSWLFLNSKMLKIIVIIVAPMILVAVAVCLLVLCLKKRTAARHGALYNEMNGDEGNNELALPMSEMNSTVEDKKRSVVKKG